MPISISDIPKKKILSLANVPRDILYTREGLTTALVINLEMEGGFGLDILVESTSASTDNSTTFTIDRIKTLTVSREGTVSLDNVLFAQVEIPAPAVAHSLNIYILGISKEALQWV